MATGSAQLTTERVGARVYVRGNTYPIKDRLKAAGCHLERGANGWDCWVGAAKAAAVQAIVDEFNRDGPPPARVETADDINIYAKATYKGGTYYVRAYSRDGRGVRLVSFDGRRQFWADLGDGPDQVQVVKPFKPIRDGYGRHARERPMTLGSLQRFVARQREAEKSGAPTCAACGRVGPLVEDLEDGMMKCPGCADLPSS